MLKLLLQLEKEATAIVEHHLFRQYPARLKCSEICEKCLRVGYYNRQHEWLFLFAYRSTVPDPQQYALCRQY